MRRLLLLALLVSGCVFEPPAGVGGAADAQGPAKDAADVSIDAQPDAGMVVDVGAMDIGPSDAVVDSGMPDVGDPDTGMPDTGPVDTGVPDSGDAGPEDTGPVNRPPMADDDVATTAVDQPVDVSVLDNDSDPDGDMLSVVSATALGGGSATIVGDLVRYVPAAGFSGIELVDYTIQDPGGLTASAQIEVTVPPNPLSISPATVSGNVNSWTTFSASGGVPPYTFSVESGDGAIDAQGLYFSPPVQGSAVIRVADAGGSTADANIDFGGDFWLLGGVTDNAGDTAQIWRSSNGTTWTTNTSLPGPRYLHAAVVYDDRIWVIGGRSDINVFSSVLVSSDGANWTTVGNLPATVRGTTLVVHDEAMLAIGGRLGNGTRTSDVLRSTDGVTWTNIGNIPFPRAYGAATRCGTDVCFAGGSNGNIQEEVFASLNAVNWGTTTMPAVRLYGATVFYQARFWFMGGSSNASNAVTTVWSSADIINFDVEPSLPFVRAGGHAIVRDNLIWYIGGADGFDISGDAKSNVWTFDGASWSTAGTLPDDVQWSQLVLFTP